MTPLPLSHRLWLAAFGVAVVALAVGVGGWLLADTAHLHAGAKVTALTVTGVGVLYALPKRKKERG